MKNSTRWFGWIGVIAALHMSEQLLFGIGELQAVKQALAVYYGWFQQPDYGTVLLVTTVALFVYSMMFGILVGGTWREISLGVMGMIALAEVHHVIEAIQAGGYTQGSITAVPYIAFGALLLRALIREHREDRAGEARQAVVAAA